MTDPVNDNDGSTPAKDRDGSTPETVHDGSTSGGEPSLPTTADPRLQSAYVETCACADDGRVVLVGVVHDHPASAYRVRRVIEHVDPDVLALELPAIAIPFFEQQAADEQTPPKAGGEMSAAIQAVQELDGQVSVSGIDLPSRRFARELATVVANAKPSFRTLRNVAGEVFAVASHAVRCRVAATTSTLVSMDALVGHVDHGVTPADTAMVQADHEASHLARSRSLLGAIERPAAMRLTDEARERAMAARVSRLASDGDVVAVVGFDHLENIAGYLS